MLVRLLEEVDMFNVFPIMDWKKEKKTMFFDIKCHDSYSYRAYTIVLPKIIQYGDICTYHI